MLFFHSKWRPVPVPGWKMSLASLWFWKLPSLRESTWKVVTLHVIANAEINGGMGGEGVRRTPPPPPALQRGYCSGRNLGFQPEAIS
jgi:hypothetical protein